MYTIILPTYNESKNITIVLNLITQALQNISYKVIIVDDNSPDRTHDLVASFIAKYKIDNIELYKRKKKMGLGSAYKYALEFCTSAFIILMDADMSHDPRYILDMISMREKENADIVAGSRYIRNKESSGVFGWSFKRKIISCTANNTARLFLGLNASDLTGSFRLYKADVFKDIVCDVKSRGYAYQMEIMCLAERRGYKICEIPIIFYERVYGESKLGIREVVMFMWIILVLSLKN